MPGKPNRYPFWILCLVAALLLVAGRVASAADFDCCAEKELQYFNEDVRLAGVLLAPKAGGPFPGAVVLQGAGASGRSNVWSRLVAEQLAKLGLAVLLTDKRGADKSAGDWRTADFEDLALDALAGVAALRELPEIRRDRIGLLGLSQGGHVAPLAAAMGDVQFVISFVASSLSMKDTLIHELHQTYRQHGLDDAQVAFLQKMTHASFAYLETGEGWEEYLAIRGEIEAAFGATAVQSWPDTRDDWYWTFWGGIHDFDPMPHWRTVLEDRDVPAFVALGALDEFDNVPVRATVARFEESIASDGLFLRVYPDTGHSLMVEENSEIVEFRLVSSLIEDLRGWIEQVVR